MNGKMIRPALACVAVVAAVASVAAVDDAAAHQASEMNPAAYGQTRAVETNGIRVAFLGNSITLHGACPSIGWTNEWGMAASAAEKDYVHLVTRGVERHFARPASVMVRNLADFERNFRTWSMTNLDEVVAFDPQVLVIALGENAPNLPDEAARKDFYEAFRRLIGTFLDGRRLKPLAVVRGVIWANEAKDAAMADAADDYGIPFVRADIGGQPGMDAKDAGFSHPGVAAHPGDRGMAEIAARILEGLFPTKSGFTAKVGGKAVRVRPIRISAMGFNRWPADGLQRPSGQTETAGMVLVEADGATKWRVKAERAFTNAVVRPLAARVRPEVKGGEIAFTLPQPGHYVLELDGIHSPLQMFVEPKRSFADDRKAATLVFGPGNHYAGEVALRSHDRVYIDRDAYVYGSFGMDGVEDVRISGYGVICNTIGRRGNLHCHGGDNATPIWARNSRGIRVCGPTVVDSCCWCIAAFGCEDVEISHVKVTGAWRYNTDGVDICNSRKVRLRDSFIHSFDDAVVIKGLLPYRTLPVEDIRVERCVCWCSWGGTLETGLETWASAWKGVVFEDCDLVHNARSAMRLNLGGPCRVQDTTFRDIRIEYDASERAPCLQKSRADRYVDDGRPWTGSWLAIHNGKMYAPGGMYANPGVDPNEPYGSFGTATLENVEITVDPGAPEPKPSIRFGNGVKLGEIELENVRLNGRKVTHREVLGEE